MTANSIHKRCPKCNTLHEKSGKFCSRSCANSRKWSEADKLKKSISAKNSDKIKQAGKNRRPILDRITKRCVACGCEVDVIITYKRKNVTCKSDECKKHQKRLAGISSANKRKLRSKSEKLLYNLCSKHFNVTHNQQIANGWDADILLHDYKIAILWNGPWHYKEMGFSNHSLKQVVNRDCKKIIEFEKLGWEVLIYEDDKWTPEIALVDILIRVGGR
jgi:G:T-mismatch repair DNA endonuclease (very short patch repair protein)/DNA-binding Xre family transcriptional regulator